MNNLEVCKILQTPRSIISWKLLRSKFKHVFQWSTENQQKVVLILFNLLWDKVNVICFRYVLTNSYKFSLSRVYLNDHRAKFEAFDWDKKHRAGLFFYTFQNHLLKVVLIRKREEIVFGFRLSTNFLFELWTTMKIPNPVRFETPTTFRSRLRSIFLQPAEPSSIQ